MTCPRCQEAEASSERCPRCGVVVATYLAALEKMRRTPAPRPSAPAAPLVPAAASRGGYAHSSQVQPARRLRIQTLISVLTRLGEERDRSAHAGASATPDSSHAL